MPKVVLKNILGTINSLLGNAATVAREWLLQDRDGTVALLDDTQSKEFSRAWTSTIDFDKNEIEFAPKVQDDDILFELGTGGVVNSFSGAIQEITSDGIHTISFGPGFDYIYGMNNGGILEAGTYELYFLYSNGKVRVNAQVKSQQQSSLIQLSSPSDFAIAPSSISQLNMTWSDVANESGYQIQRSLDGSTGWTQYSTPVAGSTSDTETGLLPSTTIYYRIKAIGDGVTYADSAYTTASGTTQTSGDVTAPTFTFSPANAATDIAVNQPIVITANEALRNTNASAIDNSNVASVLTLKQTNSGGSNIAFTATIDVTKTIITITPTTIYGANQLVYVAINNVEDSSGNEVTVAQSATFTTGLGTLFNGTSSLVDFGDILDSLFSANDTYFEAHFDIRNAPNTGTHVYVGKGDTTGNQRSWWIYSDVADIKFAWSKTGDSSTPRIVKFANANVLSAGWHTMKCTYDGSIDTNNGRERPTLYVDAVAATPRTLEPGSAGTLGTIFSSSAHLASAIFVNSGGTPVGTAFFQGEMRNLKIKSGSGGSVTELDVACLAIGTDTSGNSRNGTFTP